MHTTRCILLTLLLATPAVAQTPSPFLGLGIEAAHLRDNTTWTPGLAAQIGLEFPARAQRLAVRVEGGYFARDRYGFTGVLQSSTTHGAVALRLNLATGALRPYLVGGASVHRISAFQITASPTPGAPLRTGRIFQATAGLLGLGIDHRLGGLRMFVEARAFIFTAPASRTFASVLVPVTAGVRF
jgi:hypothetical protein